jgi:hypothetical protein
MAGFLAFQRVDAPLHIRQTLFKAENSSPEQPDYVAWIAHRASRPEPVNSTYLPDIVTQDSRNGHVVGDVNFVPPFETLGTRHKQTVLWLVTTQLSVVVTGDRRVAANRRPLEPPRSMTSHVVDTLARLTLHKFSLPSRPLGSDYQVTPVVTPGEPCSALLVAINRTAAHPRP